MPEIYGSVNALARDLGIGLQSAYSGLRTGAIPSRRVGRRFIVSKQAVAEWLNTSAAREQEAATHFGCKSRGN